MCELPRRCCSDTDMSVTTSLWLCRASFEELVLEEDGGLRWNRLENLMEESSKSVDYDASQLWLLAGVLILALCLVC